MGVNGRGGNIDELQESDMESRNQWFVGGVSGGGPKREGTIRVGWKFYMDDVGRGSGRSEEGSTVD